MESAVGSTERVRNGNSARLSRAASGSFRGQSLCVLNSPGERGYGDDSRQDRLQPVNMTNRRSDSAQTFRILTLPLMQTLTYVSSVHAVGKG